MPKIKFKRLLSLILTLCMVATMLPAMTLPVFAANGKADTVVFPGNQHLDEDYPLLNKDGKKERSGPKKELDGINYIAHLDVSTGTLTLWNYEGGTIYSRLGEMVPGPKDMIVVLKGDNIINGSLSEETGGNITITTVGDERASLKIQYHRENNSVDQPLEGIWNNNDNSEITISGKADISIDVENTGTSGVNGIRASNGLTVGGDVNLDIKAKNTGVFASGTTTGIVTKLGDIVIDTTGDVSIDTSGAGEGGYSYSLITMDKNRAIKLDNAKTLVLKWTKDGKNGLAYNGNLIYDENDYYVNDEEVKRTLSIFKKQVGKNFVQVVKGSGTGLYWPGESVNIVADPGPADYICQWKVRSDSDVASVGFVNENAASTSFIMPNGDVKVEAYYTIFDKQAKFTKIDENTGEITWSTIKPTVKIYIFRMDDETQAWVHHNSLIGPNLGIGNKSLQASRDYNPDGIYKLIVYLEDDSILDSEFQINWGEVPTVDKTGLVSAIAAANTNKGAVAVSTDGSDVDPADEWVRQEEMDAYTEAINKAQAVADDTNASQEEVDNAATALNTATITFNSAKKAGIKVTIEVTKVTISPKTTEVQKGTTAQFTASVEGTGSYDDTVTWDISGNNHSGTTIDTSGLLTVALEETATSLTVTATSNGNSSIRDDATVTVNDIPITTYTVTVNNGSGSGDYPAGATVSITAGSPPVGQEFDRWVSSDVTLANENATTTTFEMPANHVTITATYKDLPLTEYTVAVQDDSNGTGTASPSTAVAGTEINLTATADTGYKFKEWQVISGGVTITSNKFTMPANPVVVKAVFEEIPLVSYTYDVTQGANSTWYKGDGEGLQFIIDGDFAIFEGVEINGKLIDGEYYRIEEGSVMVTLEPEYLEKLEIGEYIIGFVFSHMKVETRFNITKADETDPTDPVEPIDPTDPTDPTDPVEPIDPTDPTDPIDPVEPVDPTDPTDPADPMNPTSPTDPSNPNNSIESVGTGETGETKEPIGEKLKETLPATGENNPFIFYLSGFLSLILGMFLLKRRKQVN